MTILGGPSDVVHFAGRYIVQLDIIIPTPGLHIQMELPHGPTQQHIPVFRHTSMRVQLDENPFGAPDYMHLLPNPQFQPLNRRRIHSRQFRILQPRQYPPFPPSPIGCQGTVY